MSQLANSLITRLQSMMPGSSGAQAGTTRVHALYSEMYNNGFAAIQFSVSDRKTFDKLYKLMDLVIKACNTPKLNLKNSPPFILDIIPDTFTQLIAIFTRDPNVMRSNEYMGLFMSNAQLKCKEVLKLFKSSAIYNDESHERRKLTKLSLVFSHMLSELRAFFQNGEFVADKFRLTKREADAFWKTSFKARICVPWAEFIVALAESQRIPENVKNNLKCTIDLTCNDYVSMFEFDVFTRLFYPWKSLIENWKLLTIDHKGFVAFLTYDEVRKRLDRFINKPGSYVFRMSCTRLGQWAIGYVAPDGKIYQTIPQNKSLIQALHEGGREGFYLWPDGNDKDMDLSKQVEVPAADRVAVTADQHKIYCEIGTTFELCKICDDNEKNVKLEPCGHLLCSTCLVQWNDSEAGNTCPFCRDEIKGTARIIIDKYREEIEVVEDSPAERKSRPLTVVSATCNTRSSNLISFDEISSASESIPPALPPPPLPPRVARNTAGNRSISTSVPLPARLNSPSSLSRQLSTSVPSIDAPAAPPLPEPTLQERHSYVNVENSIGAAPIQNAPDRPSYANLTSTPDI
ncbi:sli-1 [Pristionchus pacificus]|uniref:E3 ubiquitin-protein ligase CBL n=1 Tax=Pristionchus pacificus TaxID=54126 RepID=A0A2A6B2B8_PRIPA|nr:sli-1 [Pristionchus pacificus]|eukprot:PDM60022.1 sli-1 [Pristionchus pacificus]